MIKIKWVYEPATPNDSERYLIERLWPRGIKKEGLQLTTWLKDVAPSTELRQWFAHDPAKWAKFQRRYLKELTSDAVALQSLIAATRRGIPGCRHLQELDVGVEHGPEGYSVLLPI